MLERRKLPRKHVLFYSPVFACPGGELLGYLENISPHGAMIVSEYTFQTGTELSIAIDLPESIAHERNVTLKVRSIWCKRDSDPQLYNTGFEIVDIHPDDRQVFACMIEQYGLKG